MRMRSAIKHILRQKGYPPSATQQAIRNVIAQAVPFPRTVVPMRIGCVAGGPARDRGPDAWAVLVESVTHRPALGKDP